MNNNQEKRIADLERINELQTQQLMNLEKRLKKQEKLMRMVAVLFLILFFVWMIMVFWPLAA